MTFFHTQSGLTPSHCGHLHLSRRPRPSVLLRRTLRMMKALQMMERYIDIDTSQIVRQVLLSEGYDQSLASVGTVVPKEPPRMEAGRFVPHLARWYEDLVDNVLSKPGEAATLYIIQFQWSKSSTGEAAPLYMLFSFNGQRAVQVRRPHYKCTFIV